MLAAAVSAGEIYQTDVYEEPLNGRDASRHGDHLASSSIDCF